MGAWKLSIWDRLVGLLLGLHERPPTLDLLEAQQEQPRHNADPVDVVRDDGTICGRIIPAKDGIQNSPAAATVELGVAALTRG